MKEHFELNFLLRWLGRGKSGLEESEEIKVKEAGESRRSSGRAGKGTDAERGGGKRKRWRIEPRAK